MNTFILKMYLLPLSIIATFLILSLLLIEMGTATARVTGALVPQHAAQNAGHALAELGP